MSSTFPSHTQQNYNDIARQADILQRVIASISSGLALEPLLEKILNSAVTLIHATHGTIGLVVERGDGKVVKTVAVYNMPAEELGAEMAPGIGLAGNVLRDGKTLRLDRYGDLEQPTLAELANHSVIGVPILWGGEMIGFFGIGAETPYRFNTHDAETLEIFAQHAAIAISNANLYEASQRALGEMQMLYETSQRIGLAVGVSEVIDAYLNQVATDGEYICNICLYEFNTLGQRTAVIIRGRWTPGGGAERLEERVAYSHDDLDPILDAGEMIAISDVRMDARVPTSLRRMQELSGRLALAMIPLMVRGQRIGLVVLSHHGVYRWSEDVLRPYQATAVQLALAIDHRMQQTLLYERGQQLAVLDERQRLARELHDSVTQLIFSSTLIAQSISSAWRNNPEEGERRVKRLLELSQTALREMRSLLFELQPSEEPQDRNISPTLTGAERVHRYGFVKALHLLAQDFSHENVMVTVETDEAGERFGKTETGRSGENEASLWESMYRIVQESLNNAAKHAHARHVKIQIKGMESGSFYLSIQDDGIGFMQETQGRGLGMRTMRERAEAMGGELRVQSEPGQGTVIEVIVPIKETL